MCPDGKRINNCGANPCMRPATTGQSPEHTTKTHAVQQSIEKSHTSPTRMEDSKTGQITTSRPSPTPTAKAKRGCLKRHTVTDSRSGKAVSRHIRFAAATRCLVTGSPYEVHTQDGKGWRRQQATQIRQQRTRQALSGVKEYRSHVKEDPWADRGWESTGLGEDTPMGGISSEMDNEAARWHAKQVAFDRWLERNHELAQRNRVSVQRETRRQFGVDDAAGTRDFVRHRVNRMKQ